MKRLIPINLMANLVSLKNRKGDIFFLCRCQIIAVDSIKAFKGKVKKIPIDTYATIRHMMAARLIYFFITGTPKLPLFVSREGVEWAVRMKTYEDIKDDVISHTRWLAPITKDHFGSAQGEQYTYRIPNGSSL